jgi:tetrahydromethanopterin S-methyltransferase subunit E
VVLLDANFYPLTAIAIGAFVGALVLGIFATTAFAGRVASQRRFRQPLYMDVMRYTTPTIIAHNFVVNLCLVSIAYIQYMILGYPFSIPFLALIWGISAGAIGSSVGDVHYGAERQFQNTEFGSGLNTSLSGRIVRKAEAGLRNSIDNVWFCAKFGGPITGIALGMVVFLSGWPTTALQPKTIPEYWNAVIVGLIIVILIIIAHRTIEYMVRKTYGPYKNDTNEKEAAA